MLNLLLMLFSLIGAASINVVANIFPLNGNTTIEIAHRVPVLFAPADYVFAIWIVVYVLLASWLFGFWKNKWQTSSMLRNRRAFLFIVANLLQIAWTLTWHFNLFGWTIVSMLALLLCLNTLYFTYPKRVNRMYGRIPVAVFFGWVAISTLESISYILTLHDWSGWGLSNPLWAVIYLTISTAFALHFLYHHGDIAMNTVFIWVFSGIAVKNGTDELFVSVSAIFLSAVIVAGMLLVHREKNTSKEKNAVIPQ